MINELWGQMIEDKVNPKDIKDFQYTKQPYETTHLSTFIRETRFKYYEAIELKETEKPSTEFENHFPYTMIETLP